MASPVEKVASNARTYESEVEQIDEGRRQHVSPILREYSATSGPACSVHAPMFGGIELYAVVFQSLADLVVDADRAQLGDRKPQGRHAMR